MNESRTWDALARRYDTIVRVFAQSYPAIRERLAQDLDGRARVLEIAAGTGQFTLDIARVATRVVATDISPRMIERLSVAVDEADVENVEAETMSAYQLDAERGSFDAVFCANALHVMEHPERALREFARVLAPDGLLVAPTFLHGVDGARRALSRALSVVSPFVAHTRFSEGTLRALVERSGFMVERCEQLPGLFPIGYLVATVSVKQDQVRDRGPARPQS
ncbi:MAG: class I SAM-dependent methyltransferase [Myxococcales bacterium]|nr:class I SAM-dependent methyltransferase [Myxococcales bacterium]MCB9754990.1 class I SAM-dependent methyltransferase [Myxococcales bacterium]